MCGIGSMGLFQNKGDGCDDSCSHVVCGRRGFSSAGRVEEGGAWSGSIRRKHRRCTGPTAVDAGTPVHPVCPPSRGFGESSPASQAYIRYARCCWTALSSLGVTALSLVSWQRELPS